MQTLRTLISVKQNAPFKGGAYANHGICFAHRAIARQTFESFAFGRQFSPFSDFLLGGNNFFTTRFFQSIPFFLPYSPNIRQNIMPNKENKQYIKGVFHNFSLPQKIENIIDHFCAFLLLFSQKQYKRNLRGPQVKRAACAPLAKNMLTTYFCYDYTESLKTEHTAFTPRQCVFFMPMAWMRAENTQYQPKPLCSAFSESTPLLILNGDLLKKEHKMTNAISVFKFNQNKIRTQAINGEPWFCLIDCRAALGIKGSLKKVSLSEKGVTICHSLTNGGKQELNFINEPNLYRLIFRSNKPQAQAFADWVYSEVLPSIRKTGTYSAAPKSDSWEVSDADLIRMLHNWHRTKNREDTLKFRDLTQKVEELERRLASVKKAVQS